MLDNIGPYEGSMHGKWGIKNRKETVQVCFCVQFWLSMSKKRLDIPGKDIIKRYYNDRRSRQLSQNNPASIFVFFSPRYSRGINAREENEQHSLKNSINTSVKL